MAENLGKPAPGTQKTDAAAVAQPAKRRLQDLSTEELFRAALGRHRKGNLGEAIGLYNAVLMRDPASEQAYNNLGVALRSAGAREAAEVCYRRALSLLPDKSSGLTNLGNVLRDLGRFDEAEAAFKQALALEEDNRSAWYGLGLTYRDVEALEKSVAHLEKARELDPDDPEVVWDLAQTVLRQGDYKKGFELFEARWSLERMSKRQPVAPRWQGEDLGGKRILIFGEQGFGDVVQFARFIPQLTALVDKPEDVTLQVRPQLAPLFKAQADGLCRGVGQVIYADEMPPAVDYEVPLLSLPKLLGIELGNLSAEPYLTLPNRSLSLPAQGLSSLNKEGGSARLKVGLCWGGSPTQANDYNRSFPFRALLPLIELSGIDFYSFQLGERAKERAQSGLGGLVYDLAPQLGDFADTAAALAQMDILVSADTSVVHVMGALGRPVWVALSVFHDWRYDAEQGIRHWYPSARVFAQKKPGDWAEVFGRIRHALERRLT